MAGSRESSHGNVVVLDEDFPDGVSPVADAPLVWIDLLPLVNGHVCFGKVTIEHDLSATFDEVVNGFLFAR